MTKVQVIRDLLERGIKKSSLIAELTGFSLSYIGNVLSALRDPVRDLERRRRYWSGKGRGKHTAWQMRWQKDHRKEYAASVRQRRVRRQTASRKRAWNFGDDWTTKQLAFLRKNRKQRHGKGGMTVAAMAAALGRTYWSVRRALAVHPLASEPKRNTGPDWNFPEPA